MTVDPLPKTVKEGDPLLLLCVAEGGKTRKRFHFYKDGVEMTSRHERLPRSFGESAALFQNASLSILHARFNHSGEFACSYEEERSGRRIVSPWSQAVTVTGESVGEGAASERQRVSKER